MNIELFVCITLSILIIWILAKGHNDNRDHKVRYDNLKEQYNRLYEQNQTICSRLENSLIHFDNVKAELALLKLSADELETKNHNLREQLKAESDRCRVLSNIEITPEFIEAKRLIYHSDSPFIFISGGAGTGKSFFINNLLDRSTPEIAFIAPTGLSARNISGRTIHSFFRFSIKSPVASLHTIPRSRYIEEKFNFIRRLKYLVIDEISMVRADMLDLICSALMVARNNTRPFGGVKIIVVGDLYQLSPVVDTGKHPELADIFSAPPELVKKWRFWQSPWFFDAICLKNIEISFVEFTKQFRQISDSEYASRLNEIRDGCSSEALTYFNHAVRSSSDNFIPRIFNRKKPAREYNEKMLDALPGSITTYQALPSGVFCEYQENDLPVPLNLNIKKGAAVMFVKNSDCWQNGTLGEVIDLNSDLIIVRNFDDQKDYAVQREIWNEYVQDEEGVFVEIGKYLQFPLVLAWAFNVHKMQGLTFNRIVYNPAGWKLPGMIYVALSRTRSIEGLFLDRDLTFECIQQNGRVHEFYNYIRSSCKVNDKKQDKITSNLSIGIGALV